MNEWKDALAPSPDCIDLARLGEERTGAEQAHLEGCARCQTELALFQEMMAEESSPDSRWVAEELGRGGNVVAFRPKLWRTLYAIAAAVVLVIGVSWWLQFREPSIEVGGADVYRGARLEAIAPIGDIAQPPNEFRWKAVPNASQYRIRIVEIDSTVIWSSITTEPYASVPPSVIKQFVPGKSLRWDVQALRGTETITSSETQTFRVTP